ncbi:DUF599 domain-containing protein [Limoniibacter endophyticus]|uniref:Membrane protein n=1 Tax=Limoniibacter endophyticus TaxID=1565040 RepID=A0A8J3DKX5_9HYPH|nr:DUF599 family protein [Limoniibacter endophyticus]GHC62220.1 membrane protein [Limoniibacter endophyticus]
MRDLVHFTWIDYLAILYFVGIWMLFSIAANGGVVRRKSLSAYMNQQRRLWMQTLAHRDLRMIDTSIMASLQQGTAFFASSALIAIGGCFALLGAPDRVMAVLSDLPVTSQALRVTFEIKVIGLILVLAFAFFKFTWSYRLFNYCAILIGAVPVMSVRHSDPEKMDRAVERAAQVNIIAGKHFNEGLRAIFFSIGYLGWFVNGWIFFLTSTVLTLVLIKRQFFSSARLAVMDELDEAKAPPAQGAGSRSDVRPENL